MPNRVSYGLVSPHLENPQDFPKPVFIRKSSCLNTPQLIYKTVVVHLRNTMDNYQELHLFSGKHSFTDTEIEKNQIKTKTTLEEIGFGKNGNTFEKIILPLFTVEKFDKLSFDPNNERHQIIKKIILSKKQKPFKIENTTYKIKDGYYSGYLDYMREDASMVKE